MAKQLYHLANIREFLTQGFDDEELRTLCFDVPDFRPVYDRLAKNSGKTEIITLLLDFTERQLQIDTLLALAKTRNPKRYDEHGPYYQNDPTDALQEQVSDLAKRLAALTSPTKLTKEQQYQIAYHWVELGRKDSLRGFDLSKTDLEIADLSGADLRQANLSKAQLSSANLAQANLSFANLAGTNLTGANLKGAILRGANLTSANLHETYIDEQTQLDLKWRVVWAIINKKLMELKLLCNNHLYGFDLSKAYLSKANLSWIDLFGVNLSRADLSGANLSGTKLSGTDLSGANLRGADLSRTKLNEVNLCGSNLCGVNLNQADLRETYIDEQTLLDLKWQIVWRIVNQGGAGHNLRGVDLSGANLSEVDLNKADLSNANLSSANLSNANLREANLSESDLSETDLFYTDLSGANLNGVNLNKARCTNFTKWPLDFNPTSVGAIEHIIELSS